MKNYKFTIVIEKTEKGRYLAICPALQGCYTEGRTKQEATKLIQDAIKLHIQDRIENGEMIYEEISSSKVKVAV